MCSAVLRTAEGSVDLKERIPEENRSPRPEMRACVQGLGLSYGGLRKYLKLRRWDAFWLSRGVRKRLITGMLMGSACGCVSVSLLAAFSGCSAMVLLLGLIGIASGAIIGSAASAIVHVKKDKPSTLFRRT